MQPSERSEAIHAPHRGVGLASIRLWAEDPAICSILSDSASLEDARKRLIEHLTELEWEYRYGGTADFPVLEVSTALEAISVCKDLISPSNERLAGFSTLSLLWRLAREEGADYEVSRGFLSEFEHLFKAMNGRSGVSTGWLGRRMKAAGCDSSNFTKISGRRAGEARSDYLDGMMSLVRERIDGYECGLDPGLISVRRKNRERILDYLGATIDDWQCEAWQSANVLSGPAGLKTLNELVLLTDQERSAIELAVSGQIPWAITPYYLSLLDFESATRTGDAQVRSQVIPPMQTVEQMIEHREDRAHCFDFMGEHDTSPIDLITRRYAGIAILKVVDTCPQICVYCQRNWEINSTAIAPAQPGKAAIDRALDWVEAHPSIIDLLITGGDPFILSDGMVKYMLQRLAALPHVINIRIGTRIPVTMPMRITDNLAELLGEYIEPGRRNICVVTHIESSAEVTPELTAAVSRLRRQGVSVYNQQVFTLETSRRLQTAATRIALKRAGVDPYYTFYPKGKREHAEYRVPLARILQESKEEARLLPGIFRTDEAVFNVPRLGKTYLRSAQDRRLIAIQKNGERVYLFHPWEKGIAPVQPWKYVDTSITEYLTRMKHRGEDPQDYESIWYYY